MGDQIDARDTSSVEKDTTVDGFIDENLAPKATNATEVEIGIK